MDERTQLLNDIKNRKCFCCCCQNLKQRVIQNGLDEIGKYDGMMCGNIIDMRMKYYNLLNKVDFSSREGIMEEWDKWRKYIAENGKGSWPRDAFESLLDFYDAKIRNVTFIEDPNRKLTMEEVRKEYYPLFKPTQFDATDEAWKKCCNCGDHKHGELTGGWLCPVDGQCY